MHNKISTKKTKITSKVIILIAIIAFAFISVFGLSLITGNQDQTNIGSSNASSTEPADINNDNKVDVFDLSILLSKWGTNNTTSDLNKDGTTNVFDLSMMLSKWGAVTSTPPVSDGIYGTGFNMDTLANMQVGGPASGKSNTYVSYRFRAEQQSALTAFRIYWLGPTYPGYGGGTGGTIRCTIETDDGSGSPSGNVLATYDHKPVLGGPVFPLLTFPTASTELQAGQLYHLVFTNIDPNPTANFASVDLTYIFGSTLSPRQPKYSDSDYAALRRFTGTNWAVQGGYTPIVDLTYANGSHQGQGYMEVEVANKIVLSGSMNMARERFTVSGGDRNVSKAAIRIAKTSGTGGLVIRLEDSSGNLIDSCTSPTSNVPVLNSNDSTSGVWVYCTLSSAQTLKNGQTYNFKISTDSSTSLWSRGIQQGNGYGFDASTYFNDGLLQVTTNGGSTWATVGGLGNSGDLQFYLY